MNLHPLKWGMLYKFLYTSAVKEFKKEDGKSKTFDAKHWMLKGSLCRRGKRHNVIFRASFSFGNWLLAVDLLSPSSVEL